MFDSGSGRILKSIPVPVPAGFDRSSSGSGRIQNSGSGRSLGKTFAVKSSVYKCKHKSSSDAPRTKNKCLTCGSQFASKWKLTRHQETHTKEKKVCDKCGRNYKRDDKFQEHIKKCSGAQEDIPSDDTLSDVDPENMDNEYYTTLPTMIQDSSKTQLADGSENLNYTEHETSPQAESSANQVDSDLLGESTPSSSGVSSSCRMKKKYMKTTPVALRNIAQETIEDAPPYELVDILMKSKIGGGTITYLKGFLETSKSNKYVNFKQLCSKLADIVGPDAFEYNTCCWIAHQLGLPGFRLYEKMIAWMEKDYSETRGRSGVSTATSNAIYIIQGMD